MYTRGRENGLESEARLDDHGIASEYCGDTACSRGKGKGMDTVGEFVLDNMRDEELARALKADGATLECCGEVTSPLGDEDDMETGARLERCAGATLAPCGCNGAETGVALEGDSATG